MFVGGANGMTSRLGVGLAADLERVALTGYRYVHHTVGPGRFTHKKVWVHWTLT